MKFLIVDDNHRFVSDTVAFLRDQGFDALGFVPDHADLSTVYTGKSHDEPGAEGLAKVIRESDVIFLDHTMIAGQDGDEWLKLWQSRGIDFSTKRVIGISSQEQPYLTEKASRSGGSMASMISDKVREILEAGQRMQRVFMTVLYSYASCGMSRDDTTADLVSRFKLSAEDVRRKMD